MEEARFQRHIQRIRDEAKRSHYNFTDDELLPMHLDGIKTKSYRIWRMITLAYYRGMMRGVKRIKEAETPIVLSNSTIDVLRGIKDRHEE